MNKKRILSLSILAAMLLGQLASCGGTSSSGDTSDTTPTDTTEPVVVQEYVKPDVNYNDETFTIASFNFDPDMAFVLANYTMINSEEETGDRLNDAIIKMTRQVEEELNINLELFELTKADRFDASKITKSIYAGDDEIQASFTLAGCLPTFLNEPTLITDLNAIPTLDLSHSWWDQKAVEEFEIGGVQYSALGDICFFSKGAPIATFFNKQILNDNKLEDPYKLVKDGKWTIDKMIEMAMASASDVNFNQKVDELEDTFGFIGEQGTLAVLLVGAGVDYITRSDDDAIDLAFSLEKASIVAEKIVPFLRDKTTTLYAGDWYGTYSNPFDQLITPTFMENRALFFSNQLLMALDFRAMSADFGILPMPKFDENQEEYYGYSNGAWRDYLIVPSTNKDLERTGVVLEAMGYYSQQYVTPAFIDSTVLDKSLRDEESEEMVNLILDIEVYDISRLFDWGGMEAMLSGMVTSKNTNMASSYDKIMPSIQDAMNKTLEALLDKEA